jgi:hypothetical protein
MELAKHWLLILAAAVAYTVNGQIHGIKLCEPIMAHQHALSFL